MSVAVVSRRDGDLTVIDGRQIAVALIVEIGVGHEPVGIFVEMVVLNVGGFRAHLVAADKGKIVDIGNVGVLGSR